MTLIPQTITFVPPSVEAICYHEAGHAVAAIVVERVPAVMEILDGPPPHGRNRLPAGGTERDRRAIAVSGFAAELNLFRAGRLVDCSGAALTEKAFINQAVGSNAALDKVAFFGADHSDAQGLWPENDDRTFIATGEGIAKLLPMDRLTRLAEALLAERILTTERIIELWHG